MNALIISKWYALCWRWRFGRITLAILAVGMKLRPMYAPDHM